MTPIFAASVVAVGPAAFAQAVAVTRDIVTIAGAAFAAFIAWQGLSTWRRQLRGNSQYDLARRLLLSAYKVRDAVHEVRTPGMHGAETSNAIKELGYSLEGLDEGRARSIGMQAVYGVRWRKLQEAKRELHVNSLEAKVLWGEEAEATYRDVSACTQKLWAAIIMDLEPRFSGDLEYDHQATIARMKIMFPAAEDPKDDEFLVSLNAAITRYEALARPYLALNRY